MAAWTWEPVADDEITDRMTRLESYRSAVLSNADGWGRGVLADFPQSLVRHWAESFDIEHWESAEALVEQGRRKAFTALAAHFENLLAEPMHVVVLEPTPEGDPHLGRL